MASPTCDDLASTQGQDTPWLCCDKGGLGGPVPPVRRPDIVRVFVAASRALRYASRRCVCLRQLLTGPWRPWGWRYPTGGEVRRSGSKQSLLGRARDTAGNDQAGRRVCSRPAGAPLVAVAEAASLLLRRRAPGEVPSVSNAIPTSRRSDASRSNTLIRAATLTA
jgi:hypothetical protein